MTRETPAPQLRVAAMRLTVPRIAGLALLGLALAHPSVHGEEGVALPQEGKGP